jgi:hypothetical protein
MTRVCFLGCLEVPTKAVTSLTIESAIRAFNPTVLLFADSPWGPQGRNGSRHPEQTFLPDGLAPRVLEVRAEEARITLKSLGYLETESEARKRLEKLGAVGLLSEKEIALLEGIDEARKVFGEIFEAGLMAQNDPKLCRRALDAEMTGRNTLALILGGLPWGNALATRLRAISDAAEARRKELFLGIAGAFKDLKGDALVVCGLPDKARFLEAIKTEASSGIVIPETSEFWE